MDPRAKFEFEKELESYSEEVMDPEASEKKVRPQV
jgi:hypothetical protein